MAVSKRIRFEIFKRDSFTCRYCGKGSPKVVLEVDHIIPRCEGGTDDEMNLITSCFDCNRGKAGVNLSEIVTGEDPHDKAIELMERERQLAEYNEVRAAAEERIETHLEALRQTYNFKSGDKTSATLKRLLRDHSVYDINSAIEIAIEKRGGHWNNILPYSIGILRNWKANAPH